jgi:hypothetical protein
VEKLAQGGKRVAMLINPQWINRGQFISDFGFGPWRKAKEDLVASFLEVYRYSAARTCRFLQARTPCATA